MFLFCNCKKGFPSGKLLASLNYFVVFAKEWPLGELRKVSVFFFLIEINFAKTLQSIECVIELGLGQTSIPNRVE